MTAVDPGIQVALFTEVSGPVFVAEAARRLADADAADVLAWAAATFHDWVVAASMGDTVVAHLASRIAPGVEVLFLDTGYHFPETLGTAEAVRASYPLTLTVLTPEHSVAEQDATLGPRLHERDPARCCALRKTAVLDQGLQGRQAWVTGARRVETRNRADLPLVQWDQRRGLVRLNPLAAWTDDDVATYAEEHEVILNPLLSAGYPSIGCAPCTRPVAAGEDPRSGRWAGIGKTECGILL